MAAATKNLAWGEIHRRAVEFVAEWKGETREKAESQSFWNKWFWVFGIERRRFATFEAQAQRTSTLGPGSIDLFWPRMIVVEHKSAGKSLNDAIHQAMDYLDSVDERELPRLVISSDFARFMVHDLETGLATEFPLEDFADRLEMFGFIAGYRHHEFREEDAVSVKAAELMAGLYDDLRDAGYGGHELNVLLVRLMFMFFADDTGVWPRALFQEFLDEHTSEDGLDLGPLLSRLFQVLDTPEDGRPSNLDPALAQFPYINGGLFRERLAIADFTGPMRRRLLEIAAFDWSPISPTVFGSMFQGVMDTEARRAFGAHYTPESSIRKLIGPLFMDELRAELETAQSNARSLKRLHDRIGGLRFLDPAAGAGNFLLVAYRELRGLELDILMRLRDLGALDSTLLLDATHLSKVSVDQFYAIEVEEFPARIAETALYLADHLENMRLSQEFGQYFTRFPITQEAHVLVGNALREDWTALLPAAECDFVMGNPPFVGRQYRTPEQVKDMEIAFVGATGFGPLDYVCAWYVKAVSYLEANPEIRAALVSTNSITQGENVSLLWPRMMDAGMAIDFAHRTFEWSSEARGKAAVHVVIIGFSKGGIANKKRLFDYPVANGQPIESAPRRINPYLIDADDVIVAKRRTPLASWVPQSILGSMPNDGGRLIVEESDFAEVWADARARKYVRRFVGSRELLNDELRHVLWLTDADPADLGQSKVLAARLRAVQQHRATSTRETTRELAMTPSLFGENRQPSDDYLAIPEASSASRTYLPVAWLPPDVIASNKLYVVPSADKALFAVLSSKMFLVWLTTIGGRIKSDFQFSAGMVYNTFPFPELSSSEHVRLVAAGDGLVQARESVGNIPLGDLYMPGVTPPAVARAHATIDKVVDTLFRVKNPTLLERQRLLLAAYQQLAAPLTYASAGGRIAPRR